MTAEDAQALCAKLSPRQRQTLIAVCRHGTYKVVAERVGLSSEGTVEKYMTAVLKKFGVHRAAQATYIAGKANIA
jgi:DNA-binding NarL/FixJ family response regulator